MSGITIVDVKVVDLCSKHRTANDKTPKYNTGFIIEDKDISCVGCDL